MKMKYYLRGVGVGIIIATLILCISGNFGKKSNNKPSVEETTINNMLGHKTEKATEKSTEAATKATEKATEKSTEAPTEKETEAPTEAPTEKEIETPTETPTEAPVPDNSVAVTIESGRDSFDVSYMLYQNGLVNDYEDFNIYLHENGYAERIQTGEKHIPLGLSYGEVAEIIVK